MLLRSDSIDMQIKGTIVFLVCNNGSLYVHVNIKSIAGDGPDSIFLKKKLKS